MIRFAKNEDHPQLKALWTIVFGDPTDAVEDYFRLRHQNSCMLVDAEDGFISGMLSMLPLSLLSGGRSYSARYIYAVATHPDKRNLGISTRLLSHAHTLMQSWGEDASILVPASQSLFDFYLKRGYKTVFSLDLVRIDASDLPPCPDKAEVKPCSPKEYKRIRDKAYAKSSLYACWDEAAVTYAAGELSTSGSVTHIILKDGEACAAWFQSGDEVLIRDLPLFHMDLTAALAVLHNTLNAKAYQVRLPADHHQNAETTPFGMIRWLNDEPRLQGAAPYLSLALD